MFKKVIATLGMLAMVGGAYATTPNTPNLADSGITADGSDWDADELVVADSTSDSPWGATNEVNNLYITWDATNLYIGVDIVSDNNAAIIYLNTGVSGGITEFNSGNGYTGGWQRNVNFEASRDIDFFFPAWNTNGFVSGSLFGMWEATSSTAASDVSGSATFNNGSTFTEIQVSWDTLYGLGAGVVPNNATISIVAGIFGGDNWGGPDSAPDNSGFDGSGDAGLATEVFEIQVDANGDGTPDSGVDPSSAGASVPVELSGFEIQ